MKRKYFQMGGSRILSGRCVTKPEISVGSNACIDCEFNVGRTFKGEYQPPNYRVFVVCKDDGKEEFEHEEN